MDMLLRLFLVVCFVGSSYARTPEEIKKWFMQIGMECNKEHPISPDEMMLLHKHKLPQSENAKCLMACVFRKPKWLTKSGTFDIDMAEKMIEEEYGGDTEKKDRAKKLFDTCRPVNDAPVSDGEAGCERSYLLTQCLVEHAPKSFRLGCARPWSPEDWCNPAETSGENNVWIRPETCATVKKRYNCST